MQPTLPALFLLLLFQTWILIEGQSSSDLKIRPPKPPKKNCTDGFFCTKGTRQSPIDISRYYEVPMSSLSWNGYSHQPEGFLLLNSGCTAEVRFHNTTPGYIECGPLVDRYMLSQFHFHWGETNRNGSEHTINGKYGAMEAHFVHFKEEYMNMTEALKHPDGLAIISIIYRLSKKDNKCLRPLINSLANITKPMSYVILPSDSMPWLGKAFSRKNFFAYSGSLTSCPCDEVVTYIVMKHRPSISAKQVEKFRELLDKDGKNINSFRRKELQPLNGRKVVSPQCC